MTDLITPRSGYCLCGGVTVRLPYEVAMVEACHCAMCRRWGSGPWLGIEAPVDTVIEGGSLAVYVSSAIAERGFCSRCGNNVFYRARSGSMLVLSAGLFDNPHFVLRREIFHDRKPTFYCFANDTQTRSALASAVHWMASSVKHRLRQFVRG